MGRLLVVAIVYALPIAACGQTADVDRMCELNDEFAALNERTIPNIENDPFPEPAMLEENFVEGNRLLREMVDAAPDTIRADLSTYVESIEKLSGLYADFGYDRELVWATMDEEAYVREYGLDEEARERIGDWFEEHCGVDLQG